MSPAAPFRRIVRHPWLIAGFALTLLAAAIGGWFSVRARSARLERSVAHERALVGWMTQAARTAARLRGSRAQHDSHGGGDSVLQVINRTSTSRSLAAHLRRMEPQGHDAVRLRLNSASFDALVQWLGQLRQAYRIDVSYADISGTGRPGTVDATLTLRRSAN